MDTIIDHILKLKKEKHALIIAHNYQSIEVQSIADIVGDSYQLSIECQRADAPLILFCGVKFMAETAKLLNPQAKVLLSHPNAGCPMADMADAADLALYKEHHPHHLVVCYVNSSVEVKALSDICVTSSNAVNIVNSLSPDAPIIFLPDKNLGAYVAKMTHRHIDLWDGFCPIHHQNITLDDVQRMREEYPDHAVIVHPECQPAVVEQADFVGSTYQLGEFTKYNDKVIIGTEMGMVNMLAHKYPEKSIVALSSQAVCKNMKKTTLQDVLETLEQETHEITIPADIAEKALQPIAAMVAGHIQQVAGGGWRVADGGAST